MQPDESPVLPTSPPCSKCASSGVNLLGEGICSRTEDGSPEVIDGTEIGVCGGFRFRNQRSR